MLPKRLYDLLLLISNAPPPTTVASGLVSRGSEAWHGLYILLQAIKNNSAASQATLSALQAIESRLANLEGMLRAHQLAVVEMENRVMDLQESALVRNLTADVDEDDSQELEDDDEGEMVEFLTPIAVSPIKRKQAAIQ